MYKNLLEEVGFTKGEVKVYSTLLRLGESTTGKIVSDSGVSSGKVYEILDKLIAKGLASFIVKGKVKFFTSASPNRILDYLREKEKDLKRKELELQKELPMLLNLEHSVKKEYETHLFKGLKGIETAVYDALRDMGSKDVVLAMGVKSFEDFRFRLLWKKWHKARIRQKIKCRVIFSDRVEYHVFLKKLSLIEVRALRGITPAAIDVMNDKVLIFTYADEPSCLLIKNKEIAQSFTTFFENFWKVAKEI